MDASDLKIQRLIDAKDWPAVLAAYATASAKAFDEHDEDQGAFHATHALVYAYLAGDQTAAKGLENRLKKMDRL